MTARTTKALDFAVAFLVVIPAGICFCHRDSWFFLRPLSSLSSRNPVPRFFVWILSAVLSACVAIFLVATRHWPFAGDETIIRYVDFLISRGMAPYRDILDINLPGSYAADWMAVHVFGAGAVAWRLFDLSLLAAATAAGISIAKPVGWFGGFFCGTLLLLIHGRDGIAQTGQRDLTMCVLVMLSAAFLLQAHRRQSWLLTAIFGLLCSAASTIKPTVLPLSIILWLMLVVDLRRRGQPVLVHLLAGGIAIAAPWLAVVVFLLRMHALPAFLWTMRSLVPYHASIGRQPLRYFLLHPFPAALLPILAIWVLLLFLRTSPLTWERRVLMVCLGFGIVSLVAQGKGFLYHRYLSEAFLLLLAGIDFQQAAHAGGVRRALGVAGLAFGVFVVAPVCTAKAASYQWQNQEFQTMLTHDLDTLGGKALDGRVQCLDTASGCLETLESMHLEESTGLLYDCYLFRAKPGAVQDRYRRRFWREIQKNPPRVIVATNNFCINPPGNFRRIDNWEPFASWLHANYFVYAQRTPPDEVRWWSHPEKPSSYRIYVRRGLDGGRTLAKATADSRRE